MRYASCMRATGLALLMAGCANMPQTQENRAVEPALSRPPPAVETSQVGAAISESTLTQEAVNITPYTSYIDTDGKQGANGGDFSNAYTRLRIEASVGSENAAKAKVLGYKGRDWYQRYFIGMKYDTNLSIKINVGAYEATVPLLTVSHQSTKDGEMWSRSLSRNLLKFPLFLVRSDGEASVPSFHIKMASTREYDSKMAAKALDIVVNSIQILAPEAGVLTKLSTQASRDKSQAIDSAISRLFSNGINEEQLVQRDLRKWRADGGIKVTFKLPSEKDQNADEGVVSTWRITFEEPRPSIFGDWRICGNDTEPRCAGDRATALKKVHRELSPVQVLAYPIIRSTDGLGTVAAYLLKQPWYAKAMSEFVNNKEKDRALADSMCREIQNTIVSLGLNNEDADIVTWAFINGFPRAANMEKMAFDAHTVPGGGNVCARAIGLIEQNRSVTVGALASAE